MIRGLGDVATGFMRGMDQGMGLERQFDMDRRADLDRSMQKFAMYRKGLGLVTRSPESAPQIEAEFKRLGMTLDPEVASGGEQSLMAAADLESVASGAADPETLRRVALNPYTTRILLSVPELGVAALGPGAQAAALPLRMNAEATTAMAKDRASADMFPQYMARVAQSRPEYQGMFQAQAGGSNPFNFPKEFRYTPGEQEVGKAPKIPKTPAEIAAAEGLRPGSKEYLARVMELTRQFAEARRTPEDPNKVLSGIPHTASGQPDLGRLITERKSTIRFPKRLREWEPKSERPPATPYEIAASEGLEPGTKAYSNRVAQLFQAFAGARQKPGVLRRPPRRYETLQAPQFQGALGGSKLEFPAELRAEEPELALRAPTPAPKNAAEMAAAEGLLPGTPEFVERVKAIEQERRQPMEEDQESDDLAARAQAAMEEMFPGRGWDELTEDEQMAVIRQIRGE